MIKLYTSPTPAECARNDANGISQVVLNLAAQLPKYDYEFTEDIKAADLLISNAGSLSGIATPDIAIHHGLYPTYHQQFDGTFHEINSRVLADNLVAKAVIAPSQWTADILRRDMHINPHVVNWGVNLKEWKHNLPHERYVLWNKARNTDVCFTEWLDRLSESAPDVQFVTTFGQQRDNVKVMGRVDHDTMRDTIKRAGIYLATTRETGDIASREALAAGVPVLGFNWGATAEFVVHGYNGFLATPGDFEGLLAGLYWCIRNRDALSKNALQSAKAFDWKYTAKKIAGIIGDVLWTIAKAADVTPPPSGITRTTPLVSVVIPCFNYGHFVSEAIESALAQRTNFDFQVIVVNDGSTDDSLETIRQYEDRVMIIDQPNRGVAHARNHGIEFANAEYITCLDADDQIAPTFLQTCIDALVRNPLAGIAYTRLEVMGNGLSGWLAGDFNYNQMLIQQNQIPTCNMFRKEAWQRAGKYRQNFFPAEDADLWLRITSLGYTAIKATEQPLFLYRAHDKSATAALRGGLGIEPNWVAGKGWIGANQLPAFAGGKVRPVRNYDQPDVSIIIPVGVGHETLVHDALDSVEGQSHPFWEAIVISDTHNPIDLEAYPYVRKFTTTRSGSGASMARNIGIQAASGKFIIFLDADDYLHPDFISRTLREYRQSGNYIYTDWTMHTLQGNVETHTAPDFHPDLIFQKGFYHGITCLVPTKWAREVGGFDESMRAWEDWRFYIELQIRGYCGKRIPAPLFGYRYTTGTLRENGHDNQSALKALMYKHYQPYMDNEKSPMPCSCNNLKSPSLDGIEEQDLIRVIYVSTMDAKHSVIGSQNYGRRKNGDTFYIHAKDLSMQTAYGHFEPLPEIVEENEPTLIPADLTA